MKPENPGIGGGGIQAGRRFVLNPFEFVKRRWHSIRRILTADFTQRRKPCSPPGNWSLPLGGDQHPSVSDDRARPPTPRFRRYGDIPGTVFRAAMRPPVDRDAGASTTLACGGSCSAKSASSRHAPPATGSAFEILNQSIQKPPWPPGQAGNCCACSSRRRPSSTATRAKGRGRARPAALGAHHSRQPGPRNRALSACIANDPLRTHQDGTISRPSSSAWSPGQLLAGRRRASVHRCNGRRCPVRRGKAPAGTKASRVLRRHKKKWRKNHAS